MIQLDIRSRTKNPTPSVVRIPTPPKNLRLRNPAQTVICCFHTENASSEFTCAARFSMLHLTWRFRSLHAPPVATPWFGWYFFLEWCVLCSHEQQCAARSRSQSIIASLIYLMHNLQQTDKSCDFVMRLGKYFSYQKSIPLSTWKAYPRFMVWFARAWIGSETD